MRVHSILPEALTRAADSRLRAGGVEHVQHPTATAVQAAEQAAADPQAVALLGPYRSADVAEAVEASAPSGMALLAPVATWAGVTRDDEPGCDDPARHHGTVFRLLARDTEVASRIADHVRAAGQRALVVAGRHDYGRQLDGQLRLAGLPRVERAADADLVVLAGLAGQPEAGAAAESAPVPVIAFDGAQGARLGDREVLLALPFAPVHGLSTEDTVAGVDQARRAAELVVRALAAASQGARTDAAGDRASVLAAIRELGSFDEHGDLPDPAVWLWRADAAWAISPKQAI